MKRIALLLTVIGLLFAACSPAAPEDPAPLPGVIDLTGFPSDMNGAYLEYQCEFGDFGAEVAAELYGLSGELDLDIYRPECASPIFPEELPQEFIDAGIHNLTGSRLVYIELFSEDSWMTIWPEGPGNAMVIAVFYANEGGVINFAGSFPIGIRAKSMTTLVAESEAHLTAKFSYSPGWNALLITGDEVGFDVNAELDVVPLHTLEWAEFDGSGSWY